MTKTNVDELYQGYLTNVYQHTHGYQAYTKNEHTKFAKDNICITYGELLYPSVKKVIQHLTLSTEDIFLDLGSGLGKCAMQLFMQTEVQKVIGIEASEALYIQAQTVVKELKSEFPLFWENNRELSFIKGNFLETSWFGATAIYTCSTCFTHELLIAIGDKINKQPSVKKVMSLRPLPTIQLPLKSVFVVECSWDSALCFYYSV